MDAATHRQSQSPMSVLAQAKPVIISSSAGSSSPSSLESLGLNQKLHHQSYSFSTSQQQFKRQVHISDDSVIEKQNATNQMRQAAVQLACQSQQKIQQQQQVRLSATERLAMTAKRPPVLANKSSPAASSQQAGQKQLPTLETLLAVQRQLQQHTKQHLSIQQHQMVNLQPPVQQRPLPPPSPQPVKLSDTYDKDLPPLPASSISDSNSSSSDESSQLNSLDSQSSPATSLVSIPPPPPPLISHYLDQYDEVDHSAPAVVEPKRPPLQVKPKLTGLRVFGSAAPSENRSQEQQAAVASYQQHVFTIQPQQIFSRKTSEGFDVPDSVLNDFATTNEDYRFPTPPPLLLRDEFKTDTKEKSVDEADSQEDDDDFRCDIPTPPPSKAQSSASSFSASTFTASSDHRLVQPPPLFRQQPISNSQLTVQTSNNLLISAAPSQSSNNCANNRNPPTTSSSPSSSSVNSSDGDNHSSNSSSSTSGIHSNIDSPSSLNSNHDAYEPARYAASDQKYQVALIGKKLSMLMKQGHQQYEEQQRLRAHQQRQALSSKLQSSFATTKQNSTTSLSSQASSTATSGQLLASATLRMPVKPALKQKKSVHFSDKIELVACAEEQTEDHLPNPLLARVLAGKRMS